MSNRLLRFLPFALLLALSLVACSVVSGESNTCAEDDSESNSILLLNDESWFGDFAVVGDKVAFLCHYTIENPLESMVSVKLIGDFSLEEAHQLITETTLQAYLPASLHFESLNEAVLDEILSDHSNAEIALQPGKNSIAVLFIDTHGQENSKSTRLLPETEVVIID